MRKHFKVLGARELTLGEIISNVESLKEEDVGRLKLEVLIWSDGF